MIEIEKLQDTLTRDIILKAARPKKETYIQTEVRKTHKSMNETLQARRKWRDIVQKLNEMNTATRIINPVRLSFKFE